MGLGSGRSTGAGLAAAALAAAVASAVPFYMKVSPDGVELKIPIDRVALANITADMFRPGGRYTEYPVIIDNIPGMERLTALTDHDIYLLCGDHVNGGAATNRKDLPTLPWYARAFLNVYLYFRRGETLSEYIDAMPPGLKAWDEYLLTQPAMRDATPEALLLGPLASLANLFFAGKPQKCPRFLELIPKSLLESPLYTDPKTIMGRKPPAGTDTRFVFLSFLQGGIPLHQHVHSGLDKTYGHDPDDVLMDLLLAGEKRWALYPQHTDIESLYPMDRDATKWGGTLRFNFNPFFVQLNRFPNANRVPMIELVQKPGELLMFPQYALHGSWGDGATLAVLIERGEA